MKKLIAVLMIALGFTGTMSTTPVHAQDPFIGEMKFFAGNFPPRNWAFCEGQLLAISQYTALFSILGTMYGGDGRTTFALPDARSRALYHASSNVPGLSSITQGSKFGAENHTLTQSEIPSHNHSVKFLASTDTADSANASGGIFGGGAFYTTFGSANAELSSTVIQQNNIGGGLPFSTRSPGTGVKCIIALTGIFPSRN